MLVALMSEAFATYTVLRPALPKYTLQPSTLFAATWQERSNSAQKLKAQCLWIEENGVKTMGNTGLPFCVTLLVLKIKVWRR